MGRFKNVADLRHLRELASSLRVECVIVQLRGLSRADLGDLKSVGRRQRLHDSVAQLAAPPGEELVLAENAACLSAWPACLASPPPTPQFSRRD